MIEKIINRFSDDDVFQGDQPSADQPDQKEGGEEGEPAAEDDTAGAED